MERTRNFSWQDPLETMRALGQLGGLEGLQAMQRGEIPPPPFAITLGMHLHQVEKGKVTFALEPGEWLYNPIGMIHGGALATALDSAAGCAVHTHLKPGQSYATLDLHTRFIRKANRESGRLLIEATLDSMGRTLATASGHVLDARGRLIASGTVSCLLFEGLNA